MADVDSFCNDLEESPVVLSIAFQVACTVLYEPMCLEFVRLCWKEDGNYKAVTSSAKQLVSLAFVMFDVKACSVGMECR